MIVQPDFLDHWKTRQLVDLTGDPASPLVIIRLWGFCQTSKRSYFPDMTPAQLASICHWGQRKPACHVALMKVKLVEKLTPKGFAVHQWNEYNAKLLANWENGKLGGRPSKPHENRDSEKPMGSVGSTQTEPIDETRRDRVDKIENVVLKAGVLPVGKKLVELMDRAKEVLGAKEINLNHGRWMKRAETEPDKLLRVLNDTANQAKESGLTNPAAWAETMWKQFA
ncbi:MAG: hypothetical protein WCS42_22100 [Verrucomicrobiota bacterium]